MFHGIKEKPIKYILCSKIDTNKFHYIFKTAPLQKCMKKIIHLTVSEFFFEILFSNFRI